MSSNFDQVDQILDRLSLPGVDGMLFDLGVSSPQLDDGSRGFSYMADAPLDMRMDREEGLTAAEIVNGWPQEELRRIISQYGEERFAPQIARAIVRRRVDRPISTTLELWAASRAAWSRSTQMSRPVDSRLAISRLWPARPRVPSR